MLWKKQNKDIPPDQVERCLDCKFRVFKSTQFGRTRWKHVPVNDANQFYMCNGLPLLVWIPKEQRIVEND